MGNIEGLQKKWATHMGYNTDAPEEPEKKVEKRVMSEITTTEVFKKNCLGKRACGIALLPAINSIDYEAESHKERIKILEDLEAQAERSHGPVYYSWVNTTCHPEWFKYFDVQPFSAPNVVFYNPRSHRHEATIGKFTYGQIADYEERFAHGKLSTVATATDNKKMTLELKDCQA